MEIDPVILQLRADVNKYVADVRRSTSSVESSLKQQERAVRDLEREMRRSTGSIGTSLKGLAGTLATAFTGRELVGLLDSFTRLQNNLRVAGLEGEKLTAVQGRLFDVAQKYGVELEGLSGLFGKVTQSQRELGASQGEVIRLTDLTAASLKITGVTSAQSAGAILGLSQAFASGKVKAEEYNQILEGGLQPLLQAVANSDRFGGSLGKLRQAVVDGKLSSQEFFRLILAGASDLEAKAAKSVLTLSGGFTTLTNALTVYFGEADKANGVSAALGEALGKLADNLDKVIPAIAIVAGALGARYVGGILAATASTVAFRLASLGLISTLGGTAVAARAAGVALLGAFGGPVGVAILAIGAALYYTTQRTSELENATQRLAAATGVASSSRQKAIDLSNKYAAAIGRERAQIAATIQAEIALAKVRFAAAKSEQAKALAEVQRRSQGVFAPTQTFVPGSQFGGTGRTVATPASPEAVQRRTDDLSTATANLLTATQNLQTEAGAIREFGNAFRGEGAIKPPAVPGVPSAGGARKRTGGAGSSGATGPSASDIEQRFLNELAGYSQQALSAQASMATSAEERAELELRLVELARIRTLDGIKSEKDYSATQKQRLNQQVEAVAELERERVEREKSRQLEGEFQQLRDEEYRINSDALRIQFDLADTQQDRKVLALEMLDLESRYQESLLEAVVASETASEAEKKRAQYALDSLRRLAPERQAQSARQNETQTEKYLRGLNRSTGQINEALDGIAIEGLDALNDGLANAITGAESLGDVFKNVANQIIGDLLRIAIQQAVIKPLAESLFSPGGGGAGGAISGAASFFSGLFGRASGGYVSPGQMYRVNENATAGRVEAFVPSQGGKILSLGQTDALRGQSGTNGKVTVSLALSGDIDARIESVSAGVAVEVVKQAAPAIVNASVNETFSQSGRARL